MTINMYSSTRQPVVVLEVLTQFISFVYTVISHVSFICSHSPCALDSVRSPSLGQFLALQVKY